MNHVYATGGREKYFKKLDVGGCVTRAIAIATGKDYKEIYDRINTLAKKERRTNKSHARNGVWKETYKKYIKQELGFTWTPTMAIGSGCKVHLNEQELPSGTLIVRVSKHLVAVKDGVLYDTYDCSRDGKRCVYGYWRMEE